MVSELRKALKKAEKLPREKQKAIAELILDEIQWDISFQNSRDELYAFAEEALGEYKAKNQTVKIGLIAFCNNRKIPEGL